MTTASPLPPDTLADQAGTDLQRTAARLAQDIFGEVFRQAYTPDPEQLGKVLAALETRCLNWCQEGADNEQRILRLAMLVTGLDQWGLAYTQAFELTSIPALSALIASLRTRLNEQSDALFQRYFARIEQVETDAVDFKVELRRGIHLALWHAMTACETMDDAQAILKPLGGMMLALDQQLPELGWRLLADALAHIQISLLNASEGTTDVARESTQQLFESLLHALPAERYQTILRQAGQVVVGWQQMRRGAQAAAN